MCLLYLKLRLIVFDMQATGEVISNGKANYPAPVIQSEINQVLTSSIKTLTLYLNVKLILSVSILGSLGTWCSQCAESSMHDHNAAMVKAKSNCAIGLIFGLT